MKTGITDALLLTLAMGAVILFCRAFPFLFFREGKEKGPAPQDTKGAASGKQAAFLNFVGKTVPPAAMAVLAFNALTVPIKANIGESVPVLAAAIFTAAVHLWRRNPLISIFGGTALYMLLERVLGR